MRIGVISDTHNFLDPKIPAIFAGVEHILHGGDIGLPKILLDLEQIAPVTAVLGNTDDPGFHYRLTETVALDGRNFLLHHIVQPQALPDELRDKIVRDKIHIVVFGHTHKPFRQTINRTLFFNPGYAGKSRFGMERTVAILNCEEDQVQTEYIRL